MGDVVSHNGKHNERNKKGNLYLAASNLVSIEDGNKY